MASEFFIAADVSPGMLVRLSRIRRGLRQRDLAQKAGVTQAEVRESGGKYLCWRCYLGAQTPQPQQEKAARPPGRVPKRRPGQTAHEAGEPLPLTDLGNAERFVRLFGGEVRYSHERRLWLVWNGRFWQWDDGDVRVMSLARRTVRSIYREASEEPDDGRREAMVKHAQRSESCQRLVAVAKLGQSGEGVPVRLAELDADPWLFNCGNGTLDLRTGKLKQHRREDLITMMAPVDYAPGAGCPLWLSLLDRVTGGSAELQSYLQRAVGYSLTGDTSAQVVFFLWGQGSNGKSTFVGTIRRLVGPYGARLDMNALTTRGSSGPRESLADLCGKRFVAASEIEDGSRLAVSLIKDLSGGESIRADRKYEHGFEFQPQLKLWLSGNHRPVIADNTYSIWRRLKLVPFVVTIPADEVDPRYPSKLEAELPGILAWAVEGCLQWQRGGLGDPDVVVRETGGYRREQDVLADFVEDCCHLDTVASVSKADLRAAYTRWCEENGAGPLGQRTFRARLLEMGITDGRTADRKTRIWMGLRLADRPDKTPSVADNSGQAHPRNSVYEEDHEEFPDTAVRSCPASGIEHEKADRKAAADNCDPVEGLLGMPVHRAVELWNGRGMPAIPLGKGASVASRPGSLQKVLAARPFNAAHIAAVAAWAAAAGGSQVRVQEWEL